MTDPPPLGTGKVPQDVIARLLSGRSPGDGEVVGPGVGRDGAVLELGDGRFLVAASDPITFTADEIGWYAVHVNANDVACMGAEPAWFLATLLLPEGAAEADARRIFDEIGEACAEVGAGLVGGHTEVAPRFDRPVVAGTMLGVTGRWVSAEGARAGDALVLTKGAAVEGTSILARSRGEELAKHLGADVVGRARELLHDPGLSVVADARIALGAGRIHALHDPTEGGVAGGIHELCAASGTGARVEVEAIPVLEETRALADALDFDPLGLIASGALLVAAAAEDEHAVVTALRDAGIPAARIGTLVEAEEGIVAVDAGGGTSPFEAFEQDEIARLL